MSKNDDGFTLLEIMVGLVILSLIGIVVWQGISHTGRVFEKISSSLFSTVRIVQLDRFIRDETARIKAPYWIEELEIEKVDGQSVSVPYLDGDADRFLVFEYKDDYLHISEKGQEAGAQRSDAQASEARGSEAVETNQVFGPFKGAVIETARNEGDREYGVKIGVNPGKSSKMIEIVARFGSNPL